VDWSPEPLPARPMLVHTLDLTGLEAREVETRIRAWIVGASPDAVLRIRVTGEGTAGVHRVLSAANVRSLTPRTMNVEIVHSNPARRPRGMPRRMSSRTRNGPSARPERDGWLPPLL
jgi:hypothetical protein